MTPKGNSIIIHGGGLADPSKYVLLRLAKTLVKEEVYKKVAIGKYSFEALLTPSFISWYDGSLEEYLKDKRGTYFGTCRGIDLCDLDLFDKAIACLKELGISTIIVAGGDGSSRQAFEVSDAFMEKGINIIFPVPITIDGINGGLSIGINEAVKESVRQIENIVSTALQTRDNKKFGVTMVEIQGRNRDDIMANVLKNFCSRKKIADFDISDVFLRVIPANFETNEDKLVNEINQSDNRTLILISEGAKIKMSQLTEKITRKVRSLVIGHPSQSNNMTSEDDIRIYNKWIDNICTSIIARDPHSSYCVANIDGELFKKPIDYYAKLNPREAQKAEIKDNLKELMIRYMAG